MKIIFSSHLMEKIRILNNHGFKTDKSIIIEAIENPGLVLDGYAGILVFKKI